MLNEDKVRYMTELAIFEKNEGRRIFPINKYFKSDYIGGQLLRSFFGYTFCFLMAFLYWVLYKMDEILNGLSLDEVLDLGKKWGMLYMAGLVIYLFITWRFYSRRYEYASRSQLMYASKLKHLVNKYGKEKTDKTRDDRGGRIR